MTELDQPASVDIMSLSPKPLFGYIISALLGAAVVRLVMAVFKGFFPNVPWEDRKNKSDGMTRTRYGVKAAIDMFCSTGPTKDGLSGYALGVVEMFIFPYIMVAGQWTFLGAWLAAKVAVHWKKWSNSNSAMDRFVDYLRSGTLDGDAEDLRTKFHDELRKNSDLFEKWKAWNGEEPKVPPPDLTGPELVDQLKRKRKEQEDKEDNQFKIRFDVFMIATSIVLVISFTMAHVFLRVEPKDPRQLQEASSFDSRLEQVDQLVGFDSGTTIIHPDSSSAFKKRLGHFLMNDSACLGSFLIIGHVDNQDLSKQKVRIFGSNEALAMSRAQYALEQLLDAAPEETREHLKKRIALISAGPLHTGETLSNAERALDRKVVVFALVRYPRNTKRT